MSAAAPTGPSRPARQAPSRLSAPDSNVIRAEIVGDDTASAGGITVKASAPVIALCLKLVEAGHDPATPLEAYRTDVMAIRVRAIGEAASLEINSKGTSLIRRHAVRRGPPIAKSASTYVEVPGGSEAGL